MRIHETQRFLTIFSVTLLVALYFFDSKAAFSAEDIQTRAFQIIEAFATKQEKVNEERRAQFAATLEDSNDREERMVSAFGLSAYHLGKKQFQEALYYLNSADSISNSQDILAPLIELHKSIIAFESGAFRKSILFAKDIEKRDKNLGTVLALYRARIIIEAYNRIGMFHEAIDYGKRTHKKFPNSGPRHSDIQVALARSYLRLGKIGKDFYTHLERVASFYPFSEDSKWAFERLNQYACKNHTSHKPNDPQIYHYSQNLLADLARNANSDEELHRWVLDALAQNTVSMSGKISVVSSQDQISFLINNRLYADAFTLAQNLMKNPNQHSQNFERPKLLLQLARSAAETQNDDLAVRYYEQHAQENFGGNFPVKVAELVGYAYLRLRDFDRAAQTFSLAASRGNAPDYVRWQHFWSVYRGKKWDQALALLDRKNYVVPQDPSEPNSLMYWKAKIFENLNQQSAAKAQYAALVQRDPASFYAPLVRDRYPSIGNNEPLDIEPPLTASLLDSFPQMNRDQSKINRTKSKDHYPIPYEEYVNYACEKLGVDRYFLLSVMRAESRFNANAVSPVGARGLLQIMPYTSAKIAAEIQHHQFSLEDLETPEVNITYGAYYLRILLDLFNHNPLVASAAYNAGPMAVNRWLERCKDCTVDEFVEAIPYRETRRYVKEVFRNFSAYLQNHDPNEKIPLKWELPPPVSDLKSLY